MRIGSLFSGIGGIDLAFDRAGFSVAWQVEIDRQAASVLAHHWPDVPRFEDVNKVGKRNLPRVDIIAGGFPCQSLSVAGQRAGLADLDKSGLWFQMLRITNELRPSFLLFENVPGLLSSNGGRDFAIIIRGLADVGYHGAWRTLDACRFGVPQRRRRVFGLFARGRSGAERCAEILSLRESVRRYSQASGEARQDVAATISGGLGIGSVSPTITSNGDAHSGFRDDHGLIPTLSMCLNAKAGNRDDGESETFIAHTLRGEGFDASEDGTGRGTPLVYSMQERMESLNPDAGPNGKGWDDSGVAFTLEARHRPQTVAGQVGVRRLTPLECERLQGLPDRYTEFDANGKQQADGPRYKQIGNGVAVPVVEWIARRIADFNLDAK